VKPLFTAAEIAALTQGRLVQGEPHTPVTGFTWDSRLVKPGDCFVAMPGERVDGHDYAARAAAAGAALILCGRPVEAPRQSPEAPVPAVVIVPDPLIALGQLGRAQRERFPHLTVIGVTGSVGKTTTKEMVAAVLSERFRVFRSRGNFNSEVGLPVMLMDLAPEDEVAVLEMGMRALGEIDYLTSIARPAVGMVTNVGITHLELLGSRENIARAKGELVRALPESGHAILNADDPFVRAMAPTTRAHVWYYGASARGMGERWVTAVDARREGEAGQRFRLVTSLGEVEAYLPAPGQHNLANAMAAAAAGLSQGMALADVARGLERFANAGNRMRIFQAGGVRVIDDTYNAAPASVIAALRVMREMAGEGRCIAVLGDMYELGALAEQGHREVGAEAARLADRVIAVGDMARHIAAEAGAKAIFFPRKPEAIAHLKGLLRPGDTVLVKGSRGMQMEEIVRALAE
jgi:UDP-N-acetylmuramoyl-tripeptide--D-alanyl-D-alanine ligase